MKPKTFFLAFYPFYYYPPSYLLLQTVQSEKYGWAKGNADRLAPAMMENAAKKGSIPGVNPLDNLNYLNFFYGR